MDDDKLILINKNDINKKEYIIFSNQIKECFDKSNSVDEYFSMKFSNFKFNDKFNKLNSKNTLKFTNCIPDNENKKILKKIFIYLYCGYFVFNLDDLNEILIHAMWINCKNLIKDIQSELISSKSKIINESFFLKLGALICSNQYYFSKSQSFLETIVKINKLFTLIKPEFLQERRNYQDEEFIEFIEKIIGLNIFI